MREDDVTLDGPDAGLRLGYVEWGGAGASAAAGRTVLCVHGLTRNARDFDPLGEALAALGARVLAVDVVGRGRSSRLPDATGYAVPTYARQLLRFMDLLGLGAVDWVGTSMGGLIGMALAPLPGPPRISRLVLNDVGPFVPKEALAPIGAYLGLDLLFPSLEAVEAHLRAIHAGFGDLSDAHWRHLATHGARAAPEGGYRLAYDPAIREPFVGAAPADIDLWPLYDAIRCPTLLLRGGASALLTEATALEMTRRGPKADLVTFPGVGHAPALAAPAQIGAVAGWLEL